MNDNVTTRHGDNIACQIQTHDAYGDMNELTTADLWSILDGLNSHFLDHNRKDLCAITLEWLTYLDKAYPDLDMY